MFYGQMARRWINERMREIGRSMCYGRRRDRWERKARQDKERGGERDNPSASSFVQIDPDLDNAPPPPAFSPTSGPIQCKYPTSQLLCIRLYEVTDHGRPTWRATERSAGRHKETVQQDQQHQSGGLHGACVATRKGPEQRDKGESQRRERRGDRHFKGQPVMQMRGRKQRERGGGVSRQMERRAVSRRM